MRDGRTIALTVNLDYAPVIILRIPVVCTSQAAMLRSRARAMSNPLLLARVGAGRNPEPLGGDAGEKRVEQEDGTEHLNELLDRRHQRDGKGIEPLRAVAESLGWLQPQRSRQSLR